MSSQKCGLRAAGTPNTQGLSGLPVLEEAWPKTGPGLFCKSIFAVKGSQQTSEYWLPCPTPSFCQGMKTTFWKGTLGIWVGSSWDRSMWVEATRAVFTQLLFILISILPRTLCPHHTYSWSSPNTDPDSFLKDWWLRTCPVFLFSPSYRLPKATNECIHLLKKKKSLLQIFSGFFEYKIFIPDSKLQLGA